MITELELEIFDNLYQLICNNLNQSFILLSEFKPASVNDESDSSQTESEWKLNLIGLNEFGKEIYFIKKFNLNELNNFLISINSIFNLTSPNKLLNEIFNSFQSGKLLVKNNNSESRDNFNESNSVQLLFELTTSLIITINLNKVEKLPSNSNSPYFILEELIPLALNSNKLIKENIQLKLNFNKLEKDFNQLKLNQRIQKEELKKLNNKLKGVKHTSTTTTTGGEVLKKAPIIQKGRKTLSTQDEMQIGEQSSDSD